MGREAGLCERLREIAPRRLANTSLYKAVVGFAGAEQRRHRQVQHRLAAGRHFAVPALEHVINSWRLWFSPPGNQ